MVEPASSREHRDYNWLFLVELLIFGFLSILFLFYFNRAFAKLISILIRLYLRWIGDSHYIDIQSLQISLLAGRIFFGKTVYHGPNETISIVSGHVTWRYWLSRVRQVTAGTTDGEAEEAKKKGNGLKCRLLVEAKGVEWFVYNRTPAYENIFQQMSEKEPPTGSGSGPAGSVANQDADGKSLGLTSLGTETHDSKQSQRTRRTQPEVPEKTFEELVYESWYLKVLPVGIEFARGAVIVGNNNTPSIMVANFDKASGSVDASKSRAAADQYKQSFNLTFTRPVVSLKQNANFKENFAARGERVRRRSQVSVDDASEPQPERTRKQKLHDMLPFFSKSMVSVVPSEAPSVRSTPMTQAEARSRWVGLARYREDMQQEGGLTYEPKEYAAINTILDSPRLSLSFYWDVPGIVPQYTGFIQTEDRDNINGPGSVSPEWGMDISIEGGNIFYGPWADRQRMHLQSMFAPRLYKSATPAQPLTAGQPRAYTEMKIVITLSGSTTLQVPVREASKDWRYHKPLEDGETRPHGWLEVKVAPESRVVYNMSMVALENGWNNSLKVDLRSPELRSSVNHGLLYKAKAHTLDCDLSGPLQWNGDTTWTFNNRSTGSQFFLLREHVILLTDLATDWTTGPPPDYYTFTPMIYKLNLCLEDFELFLNVNDQNIIDSPSDFDDNTFIVLRNLSENKGWLETDVTMDFREYRAPSSSVSFDIRMNESSPGYGMLELGVNTPIWNTWNNFFSTHPTVGSAKKFKLAGSYTFFSDVSVDLIDTLVLDLSGDALNLTLAGVLIRYFLIVRENYFGENMHFKTLEEWQALQSSGRPLAPIPTKKSNDIDVELSVHVQSISLELPKRLTGGEGLLVECPGLGLDLRFTNYYMDLQVDIAPLSMFHGVRSPHPPQVFVDVSKIYGHRLFGLPPSEPTYICNWDLSFGAISGESNPNFLQTMISAMSSIVFGFKDVENTLPVPAPVLIYDVTFLRLNVGAIRLWLRMEDNKAFRIVAEKITFVLNDLADEKHSDKISLKIPGLAMCCLELGRERRTLGYAETEVNVTNYGRKKDAENLRRQQRKHVRESDERTGRAAFLLQMMGGSLNEIVSVSDERETAEPSMSVPGLPPPIFGARYGALQNYAQSRHTTSSSGKSRSRSFLAPSTPSVSGRRRQASLLQPGSIWANSSRAPSFHSALESLSDQPLATPSTPHLSRGPSVAGSPVSGTSRRNTAASRTRGLSLASSRVPSFILTSSFARPKYPLDSVEPDISAVPELSGREARKEREDTGDIYGYEAFTDFDSKRDSVVVEFLPGIRGYCTPDAIMEVVTLLERLQVRTPDDILQTLHINVMEEVATLLKREEVENSVVEACIDLPEFKFAFVDRDTTAVVVELRHLLASLRSKKVMVPETKSVDEILSAHVSLASIKLALTNTTRLPSAATAKPAATLLMDNALFWASKSSINTADFQIQSLITSVSGQQARFIYDAILSLSSFASALETKLAVLKLEKRRIKGFWCALASENAKITNDPSSLTRPSYVLRSAASHVRLNDSWKLLVRMQHVWQHLPLSLKNEWANSRWEDYQLPLDARERVGVIFERWRGWEMENISGARVIEEVFGKRAVGDDVRKEMAIVAKVEVERMGAFVDPGPTENELSLDGFGAEIKISGAGGAVVLVHSRKMDARLRWELLEVVAPVLEVLSTHQKSQTTTARPASPTHFPTRKSLVLPASNAAIKKKGGKGSLHLLVTAETATFSLYTVNLRIFSIARNLKASFLASSSLSPSAPRVVSSLTIAADHASSEICYGLNKVLSLTILQSPLVYAHADKHAFAETEFRIWKTSATCDSIEIEVREQVLGLCEVVDFLVNDEFAQILLLVKKIQAQLPSEQPSSPVLGPALKNSVVNQIYATFLLNSFKFTTTLLPSLTYLLNSDSILLQIRPNEAETKEMLIDWEIGSHEHEVRSCAPGEETRSISVLQMPAIIGGLRFWDGLHEQLFEGVFKVAAIELDASAIQSLLNALNKPEVVKVGVTAKTDLVATAGKLKEILGENKTIVVATRRPSIVTKNKKPQVYRVHASVEGVTIGTTSHTSNLEVNLGRIYAAVTNRPTAKPGAALLSIPEVYLELRQIVVELNRFDGESTKNCGSIELHASLKYIERNGLRVFAVESHQLKVNLNADTAPTAVDVAGHLQDRLKDLDLSREVKYLRRLRKSQPLQAKPRTPLPPDPADEVSSGSMTLLGAALSMDLRGIQISWLTGPPPKSNVPHNNLVVSFKRIHFTTATRRDDEAQLAIEEFLVQLAASGRRFIPDAPGRSENSALMPEVVFTVINRVKTNERRLAFQARGTELDIRLTSSFVVALSAIESSISTSVGEFRSASASWKSTPTQSGADREKMFGSKRLASVLVDADFAGAVVHVRNVDTEFGATSPTQGGVYGQFMQGEPVDPTTTLRSPGLAFVVEYSDPLNDDPTLTAEINVSPSTNILYPSVVSLVMEMSDNIKEIMRTPTGGPAGMDVVEKIEEVAKTAVEEVEAKTPISSNTPADLLGKCKVDIGLRIGAQEFTLSCQPIARVAATAGYEMIYITVNTCNDASTGRFYAITAAIVGLKTSLQHVYSRESTGRLEVEKVFMNLMNSKHVVGSEGLSCVVQLSPVKCQMNMKQFQDFLLFREIWLPPEDAPEAEVEPSSAVGREGEPSEMLVQRYHKVAATKAFPWNTNVIITQLDLSLGLGKSLGQTEFSITNIWASTKKTSEWEQSLCLGWDAITVSSVGRLSGFVALRDVRVRTSINWRAAMGATEEIHQVKAPLIEASLGFKQLQVKAGFDYEPFLIANITAFDFLMYNIQDKGGDRLVGVLDGEKVQVFFTTLSAAHALGLYQALERLMQEKNTALETSLKEVERFLNRKRNLPSTPTPAEGQAPIELSSPQQQSPTRLFSLHTDVVVNLQSVNIGAFPSNFLDNQVFKLDALNATARFAVETQHGGDGKDKVHSFLDMTLGQLRVSLSTVKGAGLSKDVGIEEVIKEATECKGGIILKVPMVTASMHTWTQPGGMSVDYVFKSAFEGQVDVGWNFSRVSFIKGMWQRHVRALAQKQGKAPFSSRISVNTDNTPPSSVAGSDKGVDKAEKGKANSTTSAEGEDNDKEKERKITAVVNVPQSRYEYNALEPPVIETPLLRDMGEATPPLEWIGLHRERLPNLTHQIVIVSLLEIASEVDSAYGKILGSS